MSQTWGDGLLSQHGPAHGLTHLLPTRFLVRLLLVHGTLADYRLGRLIKYSFYKNITFAFIFLFFQPFNGVSGQVGN